MDCKDGSSKHISITEEDFVYLDDSFFEHSGGIRTDSETTRSHDDRVARSTTEDSKSSNSVLSSSAENSSDDLFQVDTIISPISETTDHEAHPKSKESTTSPIRDGKNDVYSGPLIQLEEMFGSSRSISQVSDVTHESFIPVLSRTHSPPIQVMERPRGFDPDRIPASVFTKSCSDVYWSVASSESLFSIQMGISFSRDHDFMLPGDTNKNNEIGKSRELYISKELYKSGELDKLSEVYLSGEFQHSSELVRFRQPSPVTKGEHKDRHFDLGKNGVCKKTEKNLPKRTIKDEREINVEANRCLDETRTNIQSFAFPMSRPQSQHAFVILVVVDSGHGYVAQAAVVIVQAAQDAAAVVSGQATTVVAVENLYKVVSLQSGQAAIASVRHGQAAIVGDRAVLASLASVRAG
ncbi:hypothetical protein ACH5RR_030445 [Cinchona calisaya]|uniref:Uncharacterized protein n=1 Tax=Cinchona calisaya TaxID=153742 RepID=A0ABD2YXL5_9GENT